MWKGSNDIFGHNPLTDKNDCLFMKMLSNAYGVWLPIETRGHLTLRLILPQFSLCC